MKKLLQHIAFFSALVFILSAPVSAIGIMPLASSHIESTDCHIAVSSSNLVTVYFSIEGTDFMSELGASMIRVQRSTDGINWEICDTYWASDHPEMMGSGLTFNSSITYQGQAGYQYRAFIYFHAKNSSGTRTAMAYAY